jgi:glycosyltransferase involved in cell wall biosynthesis
LRILVLCHEYPPVGGGASSVSHTLAEGYAAAGHEVVVVTMAWRQLPATATSASGVTVHRIRCLRRSREQAGVAIALLWAARALRWSRQEHRRCPFDVTHAHFVMPAGIVAARLRQRLEVPYVLTPHGSDVPGFDPRRFRLAHRLVRSQWRQICAGASCIAAPSRSLQALLRAAAPSLESVRIPNPIQREAFATGPKEQRILLCGRLVERKGFADLLESLRGIELPGWCIDVVGDGPEGARLRAIARELKVPVSFHGWLEHGGQELRGLFARAAIFAFPSWRENLPVTLLEAMAAECAIVATDLPGNVEAVGECAHLVAPADRGALRSAVVELTASPSRRAALGEAARRRVAESFSESTVVTSYLDRLAAARRRP